MAARTAVAVKHLTPAALCVRWDLADDDGSTKAGERYLANLRTQGRGPAYFRGESNGTKARILYRLADVEAYEESRLVKPSAA